MATVATESRSKRHLLGLAAVGGAALMLGVWFGVDRAPPAPAQTLAATVLKPPKLLADFTLVDHRGRPFNKTALAGKWTFLFFGYTHCPDVCPTTLGLLAQIDGELNQQAQDSPRQMVFVSVDPSRDTPAALAKYVAYFSPRLLGVTGKLPDIEVLTRQLGILHMRVANDADSGYLVDHSASLLLIGPDAALHAIFSAPHTLASVVTDFLAISAAR